ncbi:D-2-hydroxyacid dehydrogenase [Chloroflexota bacterium]
MDTINVLIATKLEEVFQRQIADVDRRVKVYDAADLINAEWVREPGIEASAEAHKELDGLLREAEIIVLSRPPRELSHHSSTLSDLLSRATNLKWIQYTGAGMDRMAILGLLDGNFTVTNASGNSAVPIAEYVLCVMLMFARKALLYFLNKQEKRWDRYTSSELMGKTLGIVGLGSIGQEVARRAKAFGMRLVATKRSSVGSEPAVMMADKVYPRQDLLEMLAECDFVVISAPLTRETAGMIGERELKAMKPSAFLINIARGGLIDEAVLIRALKEGWIAGAGLDVFQREPLPTESELWEMPNVIISSHNSGTTGMNSVRLTGLFCENLKRYIAGQPLLNVVSQERGY